MLCWIITLCWINTATGLQLCPLLVLLDVLILDKKNEKVPSTVNPCARKRDQVPSLVPFQLKKHDEVPSGVPFLFFSSSPSDSRTPPTLMVKYFCSAVLLLSLQ